jgi:hypothetical protein
MTQHFSTHSLRQQFVLLTDATGTPSSEVRTGTEHSKNIDSLQDWDGQNHDVTTVLIVGKNFNDTKLKPNCSWFLTEIE